MNTTLPKIVTDMLKHERYPHQPTSVTLVQTHISWVFLAGEYVYKVKKPVNFGFLDFSTPSKRKHFCTEEVNLNRRAAPGIYLGVVDISEVNNEFFPEESTNTVEWAVKMRHLHDELSMHNLVINNLLTDDTICRIAHAIADFHAVAEPGKTGSETERGGSPGMIAHHALENLSQLTLFINNTITAETHSLIHKYTEEFIPKNLNLFLRRISEGRIRDCHGDLRPEHVFVSDDRIDIIDCIEFNPAYRWQDTASDLAFLLMELDYIDRRRIGMSILNHYLDYTADYGIIPLLNFYKVYRANIRGKVASFVTRDKNISDSDHETAFLSAGKFFNLARAYISESMQTPALTITCGPSGAGKSFAARAYAIETGAAIIRSDSLRKHLAGLHPFNGAAAGFGEGIYTTAHRERVYRRMFKYASEALQGGSSVILDATFGKKAFRDEARKTAESHGAEFHIIYCNAPLNVLKMRMVHRASDSIDTSDALPEILEAQLSEFEPLVDDEVSLVIDAAL